MVLPNKNRNRVRLVPSRNQIIFDDDMPLFATTSMALVYANKSDTGKGLRMVMKMKRKITSEMMTTYLPSTLLLLITFATTFFPPFFFEAALTVNLTTMLVMTTIFISKMEGLPSTAYMKMIDIWLIFCQLVPFIEVVLFTAKEYLRKEEKEDNEEPHGSKARQEKLSVSDLNVPNLSQECQNKISIPLGLKIVGKQNSFACIRIFTTKYYQLFHFREDSSDLGVCIHRCLFWTCHLQLHSLDE